MRDASWYQYWHAELNHMLFDGKLEPCVIHTMAQTGDVRARFERSTDPYLMTFYEDPDEPDVDALTVLLHEMCHQYVCENDLIDDGHGPMFRYVALSHGMDGIGYSLTDETRDRLEARLESFNVIDGLKREA